jgi:hypothetical protein
VSRRGQRGKPRPDRGAAAAAQPGAAPGGDTDTSGPASVAGTSSGSTSSGSTSSGSTSGSSPTSAAGAASGGTSGSSPTSAAGAASGGTSGSSPISVTGTISEAEGYGAASRAELPDRPIALTALALVAAVLLAEGYLAAGPAGFVIAGTVLALAAIVFARAMMPHVEQPPASAVRKDHRSADSGEADFPVYRKITSDLSWANASPRHYDHGLRPRLAGLLDARLAQRYGLDAAARPDRARELVGAELWPLLDMSRPPSNDSRAPGVSMATVDRIVTRLEDL